LSVDDATKTAELIAELGLTFPVGHSADALAVSASTGAFVNPEPVYLQSTGFVFDPFGKVIVSVYSSGAIGRLVPEDVIGLVRHLGDRPAQQCEGRHRPPALPNVHRPPALSRPRISQRPAR